MLQFRIEKLKVYNWQSTCQVAFKSIKYASLYNMIAVANKINDCSISA